MKKMIVFCTAALIAIAGSQIAGQKAGTRLVVTQERVMFERPGMKNNPAGMVARGEKVELLERSADRERIGSSFEYWYRVKTSGGKTGWIYGAYVNDPSGGPDAKEGKNPGDPGIMNDSVPAEIRLAALPLPFRSKKELLEAPEGKRYEYVTYSFSKKELPLLKSKGFFIKSIPESQLPYIEWDDMVDMYNRHTGVEKPQECIELTEMDDRPRYRLVPLFISSDYLLHLYHLLFMRMVEDMEIKKLRPVMKDLTGSLLKKSVAGYRTATDPAMRDAWKAVAGFFAVPGSIMGLAAGDRDVEALAAREIAAIRAGSGFAKSAVSGEEEDFSQYRPRGHYNKNEALREYFKVMMWYGRIYFPAERPLPAIIITRLLSERAELAKWESVYVPTSYLVGRSDDLEVYDCQGCLKKTLGAGVSLSSAPDAVKVKDFTRCLKGLRPPRIISGRTMKGGRAPDLKEAQEMTRGFRFMGQRFIPDSYIFTMFTSPRVGSMTRPRNFPTGLDVMAILGSPEAEALLKPEIDGVPGFSDRYAAMQKEFAGYGDADWRQNIYWGWLDCIRALYREPSRNLPALFSTPAWRHRLLLAGHGSWAELRHDTILYAKQSYSEMGGPEPETIYYAGQPLIPRGYVEPNPLFFDRLDGLAGMTVNKLTGAGVLTDEYREKLGIYLGAVRSLGAIARREAKNAAVSDDEFLYIANVTKTLRGIVLPRDEVFMDDTYKKMAVVADVHTDSLSGQVLEVGVGKPREAFLYVKDRNGGRVCLGYLYSYYEFRAPMSARMTDEEWREKVYGPPAGNYLKQREPSWMRLIPSAD